MKTTITLTLVAVLAWTASALAVESDPVLDTVKEALEYYEDGDYAGAAGTLDYAAQLIRQKRSEGLTDFLPEPLEEWTAKKATSQAGGGGMYGGGTSAEREYYKDGATITVRIMTDSPMQQAVGMMLSNPMFAGADGGKLMRINKQKAIVKYDESQRSGSINLVAAGTVLVIIEGDNVELDDLIAYAEAVDYKALAALV
jgi:hypothetical protein